MNGVAGGDRSDSSENADRSKLSSSTNAAAQVLRKSPARINRTGTDLTEQPGDQCQASASTPLSLQQESVDVSSQKPGHQKRTANGEQQHSTAVGGSTEVNCQPVTPSSGKIRRKVRRPPLQSADGGVNGELWIDGPNAEPFLHHQQQQHAAAFVNGTVETAATPAVGETRRNEDDERWIDGPPEFRAELQSSPSFGRGLQGKPTGGRMPKFAMKSTPHRRITANDGGVTEIDGAVMTSQVAAADEETFEKQVMSTAANIPNSRIDKFSDPASTATCNRASAQQQQPSGNCDVSMETSGSPGTPSHKRRGHPHHHHSNKKGPLTSGASADRDAQYADVPVTSPGRCRGTAVTGSQCAASPIPVNSSSSSPRHAGGGHGGRIAQWIRSVQAATAAAVFPSSQPAALAYRDPLQAVGIAAVGSTTQPAVDPRLHSRSSASPSRHHRDLRLRSVDRAFRDPFGFLMDSFDSESEATLSIGNNSPPPDYASCVAGDRRFSSSPSSHVLDINENEANGNGVVGFGSAASADHQVKPTAGLGTRSFEWPVSAAATVDARRMQRTSGLWTYVPSPLLVNSSSSYGPYTHPPPADCAGTQSTTMTGAPEIYDVSTWPRRHQNATDIDAAQSKRLHHPDGASDPKLSVIEVARPPDPESLKVLSSIGLIPPPQLASIAPCLLQSFNSPPFCRPPFEALAPLKKQSSESDSAQRPAAAAAGSSSHRLADGELYRSSPVNDDARMMHAGYADDAEVGSGRSVSTELSCTTPSTVVHRPVQPSTTQSPTSACQSPPAAGSGSGPQAKTKTSTPASSRAAERCRSSSGVSLLSCISPRRRPRPFAGLFSRNHGSKDRPQDNVANGDVTCGESAAGSSDTGVTSGGDDASCEPGTSCCLQDSDRGSSLSDCTVPPLLPLPLASGQPIPGQEHEYDASSDYGSAQVDGEPSFAVSVMTGLNENSTEDSGFGTCICLRSSIN
jgi:hypothetical protein